MLKMFNAQSSNIKSRTYLEYCKDMKKKAIFSINLLEDLIQDIIFYYYVRELKPIRKIYENVEDVNKTYKLLKSEIKK